MPLYAAASPTFFDAVFVNVIAVEFTPRWCFFRGVGGAAFKTLEFQHKSQPVTVSYKQPLCGCRPLWSRRLQTALEGGLTSSSHAGGVMRPAFTLLCLILVYSERQTPESSLWAATVLLVCLLDCNLGLFSCVICRCLKKAASVVGPELGPKVQQAFRLTKTRGKDILKSSGTT